MVVGDRMGWGEADGDKVALVWAKGRGPYALLTCVKLLPSLLGPAALLLFMVTAKLLFR